MYHIRQSVLIACMHVVLLYDQDKARHQRDLKALELADKLEKALMENQSEADEVIEVISSNLTSIIADFA